MCFHSEPFQKDDVTQNASFVVLHRDVDYYVKVVLEPDHRLARKVFLLRFIEIYFQILPVDEQLQEYVDEHLSQMRNSSEVFRFPTEAQLTGDTCQHKRVADSMLT